MNVINFVYFALIATEEQAELFNLNHRSVLPAIYKENLTRYNWNPPKPAPNSDECERQAIVNVKLENENTQLKETIVQLQNRIGAEDLTADEMADLQETIMEDDGDESFSWTLGEESNFPTPIGCVKVEPVEPMDDLEMPSSDINDVDAFNTSQSSMTLQNESIRESSSSNGNTATASQIVPVAPTNDLMSTSSGNINDKVTGRIPFTLNVSIVCMLYFYSASIKHDLLIVYRPISSASLIVRMQQCRLSLMGCWNFTTICKKIVVLAKHTI